MNKFKLAYYLMLFFLVLIVFIVLVVYPEVLIFIKYFLSKLTK